MKSAHRFEHRAEPLLQRRAFARRIARSAGFALVLLAVALGAGAVGYHVFGELGWVDSFLNASMILTGMGPVDRMLSTAGKLFSAVYALFSGLAFLTSAGLLFAPVIHRFMHKFHLEERDRG